MKRLLLIVLCTVCFTGSPALAEEDKRIVSLAPSNTELINELGLLDQLVGVTTADTYPDELIDMDVTRLDAMMLDVEALLALKPTHIVTHEVSMPNTEDMLEQLSKSIDVEILVVDNEETVEDIIHSIQQVGEFLNVEDESEALAKTFTEDLEQLSEETEMQNEVMVFISMQPEIYTVGHSTFIDSALQAIGLENVFDDIEGYKAVSIEEILVRDPEYAINITAMAAGDFNEALSNLNIQGLDIQGSEHQCTLDPDLLARPGIRIIEGLEAIEACIDG